MKIVLICYGEAIDEEVLDILKSVNVESYTKWTKVRGVGGKSGPHLYNHIWPKVNNVLLVAVEEETAAAILDNVRKMREKIGHELSLIHI